MIRIIAVETDGGDALNIGGPAHVSHKTFDVECHSLEQWLREIKGDKWRHRSIVGVEVIEQEAGDE